MPQRVFPISIPSTIHPFVKLDSPGRADGHMATLPWFGTHVILIFEKTHFPSSSYIRSWRAWWLSVSLLLSYCPFSIYNRSQVSIIFHQSLQALISLATLHQSNQGNLNFVSILSFNHSPSIFTWPIDSFREILGLVVPEPRYKHPYQPRDLITDTPVRGAMATAANFDP